mmetsp:Transcript_4211/g.17031  ORF Transcript_4211/g.17031 Transcript_4211/m.17031 type:complete len:315 (-) Transcript_4211:129-1073(-)
MYAYCCAAAHLRLRHARLNHLMLSNVGAGDEAWRLSDPVPLGAACGSSADDRQSSVPPLLRRAQPATAPVPTFLHLCDPPPASDDDILTATTWCTPPNSTPCRRDWPPILIPGQNYRLGEWMFAKRRIPSGCRPTSAGGSLDLKIPRIKAINHLRMQSKYVGRKYSECAMCPAYSGDFRSPPSRRDVMHIIAGSSPTAATRSSRRRRRRSGGCATSCSRRATRAARRRNGNRSRTPSPPIARPSSSASRRPTSTRPRRARGPDARRRRTPRSASSTSPRAAIGRRGAARRRRRGSSSCGRHSRHSRGLLLDEVS